MARSNVIFVGIKGAVAAIDRDTGETMWTTSLKGSEFVNVSLEGGDLFAASRAACIASTRRRAILNGAMNCPASGMVW